jgi:DNA-directed RNA polymerase subunit alpha
MSQSPDTMLLGDHDVRDTQTAEKYLRAGNEAQQRGDRLAAIEAFEAAYTADPDHQDVCFQLAYSLDLVGEEDEAIHLYEQCVQQENPRISALMNLAVMYEDRGQYAKAERCVAQVLSTDPNHARARLFSKDIKASMGMVVDDDKEKRTEKHNVMLDTPVTDFDLAVRTRNSLRKMDIRTLGDLLRVTEAELRSYKNFGESSLEEIRAMLAQMGLRMGQAVEQQQSAVKQAVYDQLKTATGSDDEIFAQPVGELALSVRARKALSLLNIQTIGDLCLKTEAELMGVKNFGMTSLVEIKEKLTEAGLSLRILE